MHEVRPRVPVSSLSTAADRLNARLMGSVAMYESEIESERVAAAAARRAQQGRFSGGMRPYGYAPDGVTLREEEARHLRAAGGGPGHMGDGPGDADRPARRTTPGN